MNAHTQLIIEIAKVSEAEALNIQDVIDNEWLADWSEATKRQIAIAIKVAQAYIANGNSWDFAA